jgi:hypothetical protein
LLAVYYVRKVSESELWRSKTSTGQTRPPAERLLPGSGGWNLFQVLVMMTGFWTTQNIITIFMPSVLLPHILNLSKFELTSPLIVAYCALFFSYIGAGVVTAPWGAIVTYINERFATDVRATGLASVSASRSSSPLSTRST